ncbi:MAG TPA: BTAD domain-containing putative transcriptional regulator [Candidatus Limnocylindria bacterium]
MSLAIRLLGFPSVEVDGVSRNPPRGHKPWALLALLLLSTAPLSRERLAGLLFADADDPLGSLRWNLAELRRLLGPEVKLGGDPVQLDLPLDAWVDARTVVSGTWTEAVELPGLDRELLEGIQPAADPAFEAWLLAERRRFAGHASAMLREGAVARLAAGEASSAVELATRLVTLDEYDEEAHALLIRAHVASGNQEAARRYLATTLDRFRRELGIEPTATLVRAADPITGTLTSRPGTGTRATADSLIAAGEAAISAGAIEAGLETLRRAVADAQDSGDRTLGARALVALGEAYIHGGRGRDGEGATALHAALAEAQELGERGLVSEAARELGYVEMLRARYDRADAWLARAIDEAPDPDWHAAALGVSGAVANDRGRTSDAIGLLTRSAAEAASLDKPRLTAWAYTFLGRTHLLREELPEARAALERAMDAVRAAGWMTFLALPQSLLGTVDLADGRLAEASDAFESAFALGCQIGDPCWEGMGARGIGLVRIANGDIGEGIRWLDDARTRCVRVQDAYLWILGYCLDTLCEQAITHGVAGADRWVGDLEALASRTGMNEMLVRAQLHRASLGMPGARQSAAVFATRIDNPAVLHRLEASAPAAA